MHRSAIISLTGEVNNINYRVSMAPVSGWDVWTAGEHYVLKDNVMEGRTNVQV